MGRGQNILPAAIGCGGGLEQGRGHLGRGAGRRAGRQAGPRLQGLSELVWYALHGGWLLCFGEDVPAPELGERVWRLWGRCGWGDPRQPWLGMAARHTYPPLSAAQVLADLTLECGGSRG